MKKLYRFREERRLGGVCAGLGNYFEMDPVIFRLVFILLACMAGIGILVYLVMWVLVPLNKNWHPFDPWNKRLYLSQTDKKITGVCGGLGTYFDVDATIFRIAFVVAFFIGGIGLLVYILMILITPQKSSKQ